MKIIFNGDNGQIDANTLIVALSHYQFVMEATNKEFGCEKKLELKVNAIEKGSFVIDIDVVEGFIKNLFSNNSMEYVANVIAVLGGVYGAYKILKGKPAKTKEEKESIVIKGNDNVVINKAVVNIYNQIPVREAISKTFEAAEKDKSVDGLTIESSEQKVYFPKEDFSELIHKSFDSPDMLPPDKTIIEDARLAILSMSFESGYTWQFMYKGFKIPIRVKEGALMTIIDNGERFGKGDVIDVRLEILQRYNPSYRAYENIRFKIVEFYSHTNTIEDSSLFDETLDE